MKIENLSVVYGVVALLSVSLLIAYILFEEKRKPLFLALFACVALSNCGYFLLSVCNSLVVAKFANAMSYFGGAFSILTMLFIIYEMCHMRKRLWVMRSAILISFAAFFLAASGDLFGLFYRSLSIVKLDGMTYLVKEYGPLHGIYALYLVGYVLSMLVIIFYAAKTKRLHSFQYAAFLFVAVLLNVGVWMVEQAIDETFEFLSVSYMVTEVLLLLIYNMLRNYGIIHPVSGIMSVQMLEQLNAQPVNSCALPSGMEDVFNSFSEKVKTLSSAERRILNYYIDGYEVADIPELAFISIHTVKKHNHSIYQKLEVASRDELMLYIKLFRCCNRLNELKEMENEE